MKRTKFQLIHDILKVISDKNGKIKPTHILYKANLSPQMLNEYMQELITKEFIKEHKDKKGKTYSLTDKGYNYLNKYKFIQELSETFGLD